MKSFVLAIAAWLLAASDAVKPVPRLNQRMLMENAVRVNRKLERHLNQNFDLSAGYSIQFNQCVALKTEPYDDEIMFADSLIEYTSKGKIVAQKSYVLFNVCETQTCEYYASDDNLFMVDINTYMAALSVFYGDIQENYCTACQNSYNYCQYALYSQSNGGGNYQNGGNYNNQQQEVAEEDADEAVADEEANEDEAAVEDEYADANEDQNGRRKLVHYQPIKCSTCETFMCFDNMDNQEEDGRYMEENQSDYDVTLENMAGWVDSVAVCKDTGALLDEKWALYSSFICNEDGSGVEIGLFLDSYCSIYTSLESFQNVATAYDQAYMYEAADIITYPFLNSISCNNEYLSREEYKEMQQNNDNQNGEDYGEASEFCQTLFEGGDDAIGAISLLDCDGDGQQNEQEQNGKVTEYYSYDYYWYTFVLNYQDSLDPYTTCSLLQTMQGEYTHVYSWKQSGQLYDYGSSHSKWDTQAIRDFFADYEKMDGILIAAIVLGVVFALFSLSCIMYSCCCPSSTPNKYSKRAGDQKKRSGLLMDERTGATLM